MHWLHRQWQHDWGESRLFGWYKLPELNLQRFTRLQWYVAWIKYGFENVVDTNSYGSIVKQWLPFKFVLIRHSIATPVSLLAMLSPWACKSCSSQSVANYYHNRKIKLFRNYIQLISLITLYRPDEIKSPNQFVSLFLCRHTSTKL